MIVLDSDVLIEILDKNCEKTEQIIQFIQFLQERKSEVVTTVINYH